MKSREATSDTTAPAEPEAKWFTLSRETEIAAAVRCCWFVLGSDWLSKAVLGGGAAVAALPAALTFVGFGAGGVLLEVPLPSYNRQFTVWLSCRLRTGDRVPIAGGATRGVLPPSLLSALLV